MRIGEMKESAYLKKEDFGTQGKNMVIERLDSTDVSAKDQPEEMKHIIFFQGIEKGMVLNWTNIQLIAQVVGSEETDNWSGKQINLYEDPTISFGGKIVGGIRVRAPMMQQAQSENPDPFGDDIPGFV